MNQLYFEGKYVDLYSEDYVYLQENIHEEYLKIIDMMILDGISSYIVAKFILKVSTTDTTKLLVTQEGDTGVILTKSGLMIESNEDVDTISLSDDTYGVTNYTYCKCTQALASYDMKTETIVEERKALDLITQTLVYNRHIDKIEIVVYTQSEYEALTDEEKEQLVFLGSTVAQGPGQPLIIVDTTDVAYISARINDYVITFDMFDPDIMFPQKMVSPTSTGSVDDHYYEVPSPINIENDLNYIRTMLRDIKGSANWDDTDFIVRGTIPEITTLWKNGVFLGYQDEFESTLSSTGFINVKGGSGLLYNNIKHISSSTGLYLTDNTEYTVGDWITNDGELHYIGTIPSSFYLAYTSTGNATLTDLRIIRVIGEVVSEFQRAADPANPVPGDDYYYDTSTGLIVSLHTGIMQNAYVICQYKYKIPKITTVRLTAYGLDLIEGSESFYPEPWTIASTGILSIGEITQPGLPYLPELSTVPLTSQRNELREIREILSTDIATYTSTGVFRDFPEYAIHKLSVKSYDYTTTSSWSTTGSLNTARYQLAGAGTQIAALSFGGFISSSSAVTEKFDGVSWTASGSLNTPRYGLAGAGTQIAALSFGGNTGSVSAVTEKFDGSSWTNTGNLNTSRRYLGGCGSQDAALSFGGTIGSVSAVTEKFDGSVWIVSNAWNLNTARYFIAGCGTQIAALSFGGYTTSDSAVTEKFDGTTWATSGNLNTARNALGGCGTQSSALSFGGAITGSPSTATEKFNGSAWANSVNLSTGRHSLAGAGTQSAALSFGGNTGSVSAVTEKFNDTVTSTGIIVDRGLYWDLSTKGDYDNVFSLIGEGELHTIIHAQEDDELWIETFTGNEEDVELKIEYTTSTGGFDNTLYYTISQTSGLDYKPSVQLLHKGFEKGYHKVNITINSTINENWSMSGNLNTARYTLAGCGSQTSALSFGGWGVTFTSAVTEKFNKTSWSTSGNLNTARNTLAGCGTQSAALSFGGYTAGSPFYRNDTEKFDGTTWSTSGNLNVARRYLAGAGIQSAALSFGGTTGSRVATTEKFNGTMWTTSGSWNLNTARESLAGCGSQSAALSFGGYASPIVAITEKFDGSSWSYSGNLNTARQTLAGCGTQSAALSFGGSTGSFSAVTEKFYGSTWTITENLNIARTGLAGCGDQSSALSFGGFIGTGLAVTEKFNTTHFDFRKFIIGKLDTYYNTTSQYIDNIQSTNIQTENIHVNNVLTTSTGNLAYVNSDLVDSAHLSTDTLLYNNSDNLTPSEKAIATYTQNYLPPHIVHKRDTYATDYSKFGVGLTWSTDTTWNLNTARASLAGCGIQSAGLSFTGQNAGNTAEAISEKFNGSAWSTSTSWNLNIARWGAAGSGIQSAALCFGGTLNSGPTTTTSTEKFNGAVWLASSNLNTAKFFTAGCGTQSSALNFGGSPDGSAALAVTEKFNGAVWSTTGNLNYGRLGLAGCGIQSAAISIVGSGSLGNSNIAEKFNGSTWSYTSSLNVSTRFGASCGTQNSAIHFGSYRTERFNGDTWIQYTFVNTVRGYSAGCGTETLGLSFGGVGGLTMSAVTEKLMVYSNMTLTVTNTNPILTLDTWTTSGNLLLARQQLAGSGTQNAGLSFGGWVSVNPGVPNTEKFNNNTWSNTGNLAVTRYSLMGCGVQNAALSAYGFTTTYTTVYTDRFNGNSWLNLSTAGGSGRYNLSGCGIQNAALSVGGWTTGSVATCEKFNGISWVATGSLSGVRAWTGSCGTTNAAITFGGWTTVNVSISEKFNGAIWTVTGYINTARRALGGAGTQNAALAFGGNTGSDVATTEKFNGSSWLSSLNLNTARSFLAGCGSQSASLSFGGVSGSNSLVTEKFIGTINFNSIVKVTSDPGVSPSTEIVNTVTDASSQIIVNTPATCEVWLNPIIYQDQVEQEQLMSLGLDYPLNIAWTTTGSLNSPGRAYLNGCGTQNAALAYTGWTGSIAIATTEKFNGTTWLSANNLNEIKRGGVGIGVQHSALSIGGYVDSIPHNSTITESFDGLNWSYTGALNTGKFALAGAGIKYAGLSFGGSTDNANGLGSTEKFNGITWIYNSSWDMNNILWWLSGCGSQNAALSFGGTITAATYCSVTEKFNGVTWSNSGNLNIGKFTGSGCGTQLAALSFGGNTVTYNAITEKYLGSYWTITGYLNTARQYLAGAGTQSAALSFGGDNGSYLQTTEKFTYTVSPLLPSGTKFIVDVRN